jgi:NAD(P)-dependent dehydrogenase (short-subunit alcohol dehydrogenase family)
MISNKIIIVTGGSGLIGKAIIKELAAKGAIAINVDVNVNDDWDTNTFNCDITNDESVKALVIKIRSRYKRIDGLVNNAYPRTADWSNKFEDVTLESWRKNVDMQLNSCFFLSQQVLAVMKEQKKGSIVNIASIYGVVGNDFTVYENTGGMTSPAAYSAIKGGVINFTRYLAAYYGHLGIRVNCVSPGGIFNHQHKAFVDQFEKKVPLKRMGKPEEIAPAISFLLSDEASYITGCNLMVDGGWTAI